MKYKFMCENCGMKSSIESLEHRGFLLIMLLMQKKHKEYSPSCESPKLRLGWNDKDQT